MHLRNFLIIQFILTVTASGLAAVCIGAKNAKTVAVYLHGMDSEPPSDQELKNRSGLLGISKSLKMGFAIPRSQAKCPDGKMLCWGWNFNDSKSVDTALAIAISAKAECFPNAASGGLIGFSNGGFVTNQIVKDCRKTDFKWLISIGAGGSWNANETKDLSKCSSITLLAGKKDKYNFEPIKNLGNWLRTRGANSKIVEYDDGHNLPEKDLEKLLKSVIAEQ